MNSINGLIRKFALVLILADVAQNLKSTWDKIGKDFDRFKEMAEPFVQRYIGDYKTTKDLMDLKKAVLKATDNEVELVFDKGKWTLGLKKKPEPVAPASPALETKI